MSVILVLICQNIRALHPNIINQNNLEPNYANLVIEKNYI